MSDSPDLNWHRQIGLKFASLPSRKIALVTQFGWREKPSYVCGLQGCFWGTEGSESAPALLKTSVPTFSALQLVKGVKKDDETFVAHLF